MFPYSIAPCLRGTYQGGKFYLIALMVKPIYCSTIGDSNTNLLIKIGNLLLFIVDWYLPISIYNSVDSMIKDYFG